MEELGRPLISHMTDREVKDGMQGQFQHDQVFSKACTEYGNMHESLRFRSVS